MALLGSAFNYCHAQSINWAVLNEEDKHLLNLQLGIEHGIIYALHRILKRHLPFQSMHK